MLPCRFLRIPWIVRNKLPSSTRASPVCSKDMIRIKKIGNRQIKFGKIIRPFGIQLSPRRIKACQTGLIDRPDGIDLGRPQNEFPKFPSRHHFDFSIRPFLPQTRHRRQRQQKIPQGTPSQNKNLHLAEKADRPAPSVHKQPKPDQNQPKKHAQPH